MLGSHESIEVRFSFLPFCHLTDISPSSDILSAHTRLTPSSLIVHLTHVTTYINSTFSSPYNSAPPKSKGKRVPEWMKEVVVVDFVNYFETLHYTAPLSDFSKAPSSTALATANHNGSAVERQEFMEKVLRRCESGVWYKIEPEWCTRIKACLNDAVRRKLAGRRESDEADGAGDGRGVTKPTLCGKLEQSDWMVVEGVFQHNFAKAVYIFAIMKWEMDEEDAELGMKGQWEVVHWLGRIG